MFFVSAILAINFTGCIDMETKAHNQNSYSNVFTLTVTTVGAVTLNRADRIQRDLCAGVFFVTSIFNRWNSVIVSSLVGNDRIIGQRPQKFARIMFIGCLNKSLNRLI
jgi:hypothetical protein